MKVLLINAPPLKSSGITGLIYPPLGILYLASYARQRMPEIDIQVIDGFSEKKQELIKKINRFKPDLEGLSFTTQSATGAYQLINEIKETNPKLFVVVGGAHPTIFPEESLLKSKTDIVVVGEGEITFFEILQKINNNDPVDNIQGTAVLDNKEIKRNPLRPLIQNLDDIPFPARDLLDITRYPGYMYKKLKQDTDIISSRGCPYNCLYCSNPVWKLQKPRYRLRSPQNITDEIEHVVETYHIKEIFDQTDEFNSNKKWAKEVCDEIINRKLDVVLKAQMRVDSIDQELADKLKDAGFWMVLLGLESANERTLLGVNKNQKLNQVDDTLTILQKNGIKCMGLFMAFNVWEEGDQLCYESKEDSLRTLAYIKSLIKDGKSNYSVGP